MLETLTGSTFEFRDPVLLTLALFAPLVFWLSARRRGSVTFSSLSLLPEARKSLRLRLRWLPSGLMSIAVVCLAVAIAGPRTGDSTTQVFAEGIAIMLVVDRSGSMDARDFVADDSSVTRLDAVKQVLRQFVLGQDNQRGRPYDLIGLITFGTYADGVSPPTLDHGNLISALDDVTIATERAEAATALGEGLALAVERLRTSDAKSKVVILLTDGVNNAGVIEPAQAAELAVEHDIRVYTVGAGTNGIAPMPVRRPNGTVRLRPMKVEIDEKTLESIAERTGGMYYNARNVQGLEKAYAAIDKLEKVEITEVRYLEYTHHFGWFTLAALLALALSELARGTWLREIP